MSTPRSALVRTVNTSVVAAVAALAIVVLAWRPVAPVSAAPTNPDGSAPIKGITVEGVGTITISPDLATISVGIQAQASTAAQAQSQANEVMTKVIAAIRELGIAAEDLTTQWISLAPQYDYANGSTLPKLVGYQASQSLVVKVRQMAKSGPVIDAAVGAGANQVGGISFTVADPTAAVAKARTTAMFDAKTRAGALASAAGVSLGAPISITEVSAPVPVPYTYDRAAGAIAPTPVEPGTTEIEVRVEVTFAIA
jgi:hypothetical protein